MWGLTACFMGPCPTKAAYWRLRSACASAQSANRPFSHRCPNYKSCRNNKKRENLEFYFITRIFQIIKFKSGFRISYSVRRKLFEEATTTGLTHNLLGIPTFLGFLKRGDLNGVTANVKAYISELKILQVSVTIITHFKSVIALHKSVLIF